MTFPNKILIDIKHPFYVANTDLSVERSTRFSHKICAHLCNQSVLIKLNFLLLNSKLFGWLHCSTNLIVVCLIGLTKMVQFLTSCSSNIKNSFYVANHDLSVDKSASLIANICTQYHFVNCNANILLSYEFFLLISNKLSCHVSFKG
jgi:hypothetical protein